jgi:HSP20 family protein
MNTMTQSETDRGTAAERRNYQLPAVNIFETAEGYTLEADIPGVTREGLEVYLDQNELTLLGRRTVSRPELAHYRESGDGDFRRVFELHPEIDTDKITARVENGVLTLQLAKREQVKPRRIAVTD